MRVSLVIRVYIVTVLGLVGGAPEGGKTSRVADSSTGVPLLSEQSLPRE